jgi:hypothetical protein
MLLRAMQRLKRMRKNAEGGSNKKERYKDYNTLFSVSSVVAAGVDSTNVLLADLGKDPKSTKRQ